MTGSMIGKMGQVEVIKAVQRRQRWSPEQKAAIAQENTVATDLRDPRGRVASRVPIYRGNTLC